MCLACTLSAQSDEAADTTLKAGPSQTDGVQENTERVYEWASVEELAQFPGGEKEMFRYLSETVVYPEEALKDKVGGKVYVEFVVAKDGSLRDIVVVRSVRQDLDLAVVEAIRKMPAWTPARIQGEPVATRQVIPVDFHLD